MNEPKFKPGDRVFYHEEPYKIAFVKFAFIRSHITGKDYVEHKYDIVDDYGVKMISCVSEENLSSYIENGENIIKIADEPFFPWTCDFKKGDLVYIKGNGTIGTVDKFFNIQKAKSTYQICMDHVSIKIDGIPGVRFLESVDNIQLVLKAEETDEFERKCKELTRYIPYE